MNLRQLKAFVAVCRVGGISRAAEILHVSQPALSRQIQDLEEEFGARFFYREHRRIELTPSGHLMLLRAEEMIELAERTKQDILIDQSELSGMIRIGCVETNASQLLADLISSFIDEFPKVGFDLYSADGDDLRRQLDENRIDYAVVLEPVEIAKYESQKFPCTERWGVVVRRDDWPEDSNVFSASDMQSYPVILPRRTIVRSDLAEWFQIPEASIRSRISHNLSGNAMALVKAGLGGLVTAEGAYSMHSSESCRFLPFSPEKNILHMLVRKKNHPLTKAAEFFWKRLSESDSDK